MDWKKEKPKLTVLDVKRDGANPFSIVGATGRFEGKTNEPVYVFQVRDASGMDFILYVNFEEASKVAKYVQTLPPKYDGIQETDLMLNLKVEERARQDQSVYETITILEVSKRPINSKTS